MLKRVDRVVIRVPGLPAAIAYYRDVLGMTLAREEKGVASFTLDGGAELILHTDPDRTAEEIYYLVDDVRAMHRDREKLRLKFLTPPQQVSRGWRAVVRDPFGIVLQIIDRAAGGADASGRNTAHVIEDAKAAGAGSLFAGMEQRVPPKKEQLVGAYTKLGRTADDLPYTPHFETLYKDYCTAFGADKPSRQETWRHLLNLRKAGKLPKLGEARSAAPEVSPEARAGLREMLGQDIGRRDRLPYTPRFDTLVDEFNRAQRTRLSPHLVWRLVATLAK